MDKAETDGEQIAISSVTLDEMVYLIEKGRIDSAAFDRVIDALNMPNSLFVEIPLDSNVVKAMRLIARSEVPDLPDRIIAATGLFLGAPVISRDSKIQSSSVKPLW
ncbi:MAG: PIN domain-containing protein [Acidobacteriota bacterium]